MYGQVKNQSKEIEMQEQLLKLKKIEAKAQAIANRIDVNCEESEAKYKELAQLAKELGGVINVVEASQG